MLDIKKIRQDPESLRQQLARKKDFNPISYETILTLDTERRELVSQLNVAQEQRNAISKSIPSLLTDDREKAKALAKEFSARVSHLNNEVTRLEAILHDALAGLPNIPIPGVPAGSSSDDNLIITTWGEQPVLDFEPKDHLTIAEHLRLLDFERGAKISGSGFPVWRGAGARLERALISYMLDRHTAAGYEEILPPLLVNAASAFGTGQLPKSAEEMYFASADNLYLIPTAEVPVTNLHRDEIIPRKNLPIKYAAYSPCFRREAGGHGKKTRGFLRVHQFNKVELVRITEGSLEKSAAALEEIRLDAESILQGLGLHYRVLELCDADLSFAAAKCYDLEVWAPAENSYLEASSCSNFLDFQSRRMNLRYRNADKKVSYCHTLNGSGLATSRVMVALLETYQTEEGNLHIPEVLVPYMGCEMLFRPT